MSKKVIEVPVTVVFDEVYPPPSFPSDLIADRFQILEMDGCYLTIHECIYQEGKKSTQEFKCFLSADAAFDYLEMFGVDKPEEDREDSDRDEY